jgi:hypothetical protein
MISTDNHTFEGEEDYVKHKKQHSLIVTLKEDVISSFAAAALKTDTMTTDD